MDTLSSHNSRRQYNVAVSRSVGFPFLVHECGRVGWPVVRGVASGGALGVLVCGRVGVLAVRCGVCACCGRLSVRACCCCLIGLACRCACLPLCCWCPCVVPLLLVAGSASASAGSCAHVREWFGALALTFSWFFFFFDDLRIFGFFGFSQQSCWVPRTFMD